jgi:hypothetical protein
MPEKTQENWAAKVVDVMLRSGFAAGYLDDDTHLTLPLPVNASGRQYLIMAAYDRAEVAGATLVFPPSHEALAPYPSGAPVVWRRTSKDVVALGTGPVGELGSLSVSSRDLLSRRALVRAQYDRAISVVLAEGYMLGPYGPDEMQDGFARQLRTLLDSLEEPALVPYYHAASPSFYDWLAYRLDRRPEAGQLGVSV